jgi:hypothetical protein
MEQIGVALRDAETVGLRWSVDSTKPKAKHAPKPAKQRTILSPYVTGAIRLLFLTGCRLREILHLRWEDVDFERGLLLLPDSKTGRKTIILTAPALSVLASLPRAGSYVIAGNDPERPRADLKRPWDAILRHAKLSGVRLHDLRHTYASYGAGASLGLPVIGRLLGHISSQTTERYAHLGDDPLRRAANSIAATISAAIDPHSDNSIIVRQLSPRQGGKAETIDTVLPRAER